MNTQHGVQKEPACEIEKEALLLMDTAHARAR